LQETVSEKDIVLMQGAGDIGLLANKIQNKFKQYYADSTFKNAFIE
jgi:UDP-N-acetylmuramate-alanine ligase